MLLECRIRRACAVLLALVVILVWPVSVARAQDNTAVTRVNGDVITRDAFHARVRFVRWQYVQELTKLYELTGGNFALTPTRTAELLSGLEDPPTLGDAVLRQMEEERLLWQAGESMGVTPTAEEAQAREAAFFSLWTGVPVAQLAADADAQAFIAGWYAGATAASGLTENDIRIVFETEALRSKLYDHLSANVPTDELAVHTRHILCSFHPENVSDVTPPTPEQRASAATCIQGAADRLNAGEAFDAVAAAFSDDRASSSQGGDVGWQFLSYLVEPYADAVRDAPLNTVIGPVETGFGFHLVEVLERGPQPLASDQLDESRQGYFRLWLDTLWEGAAVERSADWAAGVPDAPGAAALEAPVLTALERFRTG